MNTIKCKKIEYNIVYGKIKNLYIHVKDGNVIVKAPKYISKEYIDTLAIGQHTLKVAFTDWGEAKTTFTIARQFEENNNNENVSLNAENKKEMKDDGSNPKTGDNVMLYIAIVSMSIIGLGATTVAVKKNKTN